MGPFIDYLKDESGTLTLQDVSPDGSHSSHWLRHDAQTPNFGFTEDTYWFRMRLAPPTQPSEAAWLFRIAYPLLDEIDIHLVGLTQSNRHIQLVSRVQR